MYQLKKISPRIVLITFKTFKEMFKYIEIVQLMGVLVEQKGWYKKQTIKYLRNLYIKQSVNKIPLEERSFVGIAHRRTANCIEWSGIKYQRFKKLLQKTDAMFDRNYVLIFATTQDTSYFTTVIHEIAHAFYYLDNDYKKEMDNAVAAMDPGVRDRMCKVLYHHEYTDNEYNDELQAYLSTGPDILHIIHGVKKYSKIFKKIFSKYYTMDDLIGALIKDDK